MSIYKTLKEAHNSKKTIKIVYEPHSHYSDSGITEREVDIYFINLSYIAGYCHLRDEARMFKIDRIKEANILQKSYDIKPDIYSNMLEKDFSDLLSNNDSELFNKMMKKEYETEEELVDNGSSEENGEEISTPSQKKLIDSFQGALEEEIDYIKEKGGENKFVCRNGELIEEHGGKFIYEFVSNSPINIEDDTPISIRYGNENIMGSIVSIDGLRVFIALNESIGQRVTEIRITVNPYFLLEILNERLEELKKNKSKKLDLPYKIFNYKDSASDEIRDFKSQFHVKPNKEQLKALAKSVGSEVTFIWGPPGTGKTTVLSLIANEFLKRNQSSLIVSHTNIAIDNVMEMMARDLKKEESVDYNEGRILRIGNPLPPLEDLFDKYKELDIEYWIKKKSKELQNKKDKLLSKMEAVEKVLYQIKKILNLYKEIDDLNNSLSELKEKINTIPHDIASSVNSEKKLAKELNRLKGQLVKAQQKHVIIRFVSGTSIKNIENQILMAEKQISQEEEKRHSLERSLVENEKKIKEKSAKLKDSRANLKSISQNLKIEIPRDKVEDTLKEGEDQFNAYKEEVSLIDKELGELRQRILSEAKIVATTITKAYLNSGIYQRDFDIVIIDEVSMAPLPALFFDCSLANKKIVVIGDFRQLSPIVQNKDSRLVRDWLGRDIFEVSGIREKIDNQESDDRLVKLKEQRRMPKSIQEIINKKIYGGSLEKGKKDKKEQLSEDKTVKALPFRNQNIAVCDTSEFNPWCARSISGSPYNIYSAFLSVYLAELANKSGIKKDIGIISPYAAQTRLISKLVYDKELIDSVAPSSVHRSQGREKQLIILDLVEGPMREIKWLNGGWNSDAMRLLNVAVTRSKAKLIFVANIKYLMEKLRDDSILKQLLNDIIKKYPVANSKDFFDFLDVDKKKVDASVKLKASTYPAFYNEYDFYEYFRKDMSVAKNKVVISSPFLTINRISQLESLFREASSRGVKMFVVTKPFKEQGFDEIRGRELEKNLKQFDIELIIKKLSHEKYAIIDEKVVWHGSLNILSHRNTSELMIRFQTKTSDLSKGILKLCGIRIEEVEKVSDIKKKMDELNKRGFGQCPCGGRMMLKYGSRGPFISCERYPRCKEARNVDESVLIKLYGKDYFICECGYNMVIRFNRKKRNRFLGCSNYPEHKFTRPL